MNPTCIVWPNRKEPRGSSLSSAEHHGWCAGKPIGGDAAQPLGDHGADPEEPAMHVLIMSFGTRGDIEPYAAFSGARARSRNDVTLSVP
ncbi:hypothetical protein [Paeniglutamicibacter terrestris]|uniref:Glycosyltransferase family 28 N-terminal domain-containing protein n=1 Tax=Paeniglutamicibacter terrestris TaxID=2723403 RepID=A0ABX1G5Y8_9MICC|nr:hypothetical protein [Paeniglutamicibacter terrestris]NKG20930.1 hypothetical protein [Paeniglutamicibacter terrestris]